MSETKTNSGAHTELRPGQVQRPRYKDSSTAAKFVKGDTARLRAWRDEAGDLHIAANPHGFHRLTRAIESLSGPRASNWVRLATVGDRPRTVPLAGRAQQTYARIQLEAADTSSSSWLVSASDSDSETVRISLGRSSAPVVLEACQRVAGHRDELSLGTLSQQRLAFDVFGQPTAHVWLSGDA
jgi:hypothetical protein